jgi:hypothetical protein
MLSGYEYLITSLPALYFDNPPGISLDELDERVRTNTSKNAFEEFGAMSLWNLENTPTQTIQTFSDFSNNLFGEISRFRKAKRDGKLFTFSLLPINFSEQNPLEAEIEIMKRLWKEIEDLSFGHHFDFTEVLFYKLKFQILSRKYSFDGEKGKAIVQKVIFSLNTEEE